jgi:hypothetical protein
MLGWIDLLRWTMGLLDLVARKRGLPNMSAWLVSWALVIAAVAGFGQLFSP